MAPTLKSEQTKFLQNIGQSRAGYYSKLLYFLTLLFIVSKISRVIVVTFRVSFPAFFLMATSNPLQASNVLSLQAPRCFFSHFSSFFFFQSSLSVLSSLPVSQQSVLLFSLQI